MVCYASSETIWNDFDKLIERIVRDKQARRICEIGGGANPLMPVESCREVEYFILDISSEELAKAPQSYYRIEADISSKSFETDRRFDVCFSRMLAEHIKDARQFHSNVHSMLNDKGIAVHFFPTLYALPFVVNRLIPETLASDVLDLLSPRDRHRFGKFPAYYRWCRGPTKAQSRRFEKLGFNVLQYTGCFGHRGYYERIPPLRKLHDIKSSFLLSHPLPRITSYAYVVLEKNGTRDFLNRK